MAAQFPMHILVAEDNLINQKVVLKILQRLGYASEHVDVVSNGQEALNAVVRKVETATKQFSISEKAHPEVYNVVLMDVQMPKMDGLEATRAIRTDSRVPRRYQPFIIALTANAMQNDRDRCIEAGMELFVTKPVVINPLMQALKTAWVMYNRRSSLSGDTSPTRSPNLRSMTFQVDSRVASDPTDTQPHSNDSSIVHSPAERVRVLDHMIPSPELAAHSLEIDGVLRNISEADLHRATTSSESSEPSSANLNHFMEDKINPKLTSGFVSLKSHAGSLATMPNPMEILNSSSSLCSTPSTFSISQSNSVMTGITLKSTHVQSRH
jgi:CheY-like chemotaxis protein